MLLLAGLVGSAACGTSETVAGGPAQPGGGGGAPGSGGVPDRSGVSAGAGAMGTTGGAVTGRGGTVGATGGDVAIPGEPTGGAVSNSGGEGGSGEEQEVACSFVAASSLATIPTVGVVLFAVTGLSSLRSAQIDFGLSETGPTMTAPVDLASPQHRTLLLGMKGGRDYVYRITAKGHAETCTSSDYSIRTGDVPSAVPRLTATVKAPSASSKGFIITTTGFEPPQPPQPLVYVVDTDGDPVWWSNAPLQTTRAHMGWDGRDMYMLSFNTGALWKIGMDGAEPHETLTGLSGAHHDFTAIPGGIAVLVGHSVVERSSDGTVTTIVPDVGTLYDSSAYHTNAIHYYPWDDGYTLSDLLANAFVKFTRQGELVWQLGGSNPKDPAKFFSGAPAWTENHGHHLSKDGSFVFFNNTSDVGSVIRVLALDTTTMVATSTLTYDTNCPTLHLGDVQRLYNGNYLVTCSGDTRLIEITASGALVRELKLSSGGYGYSEFRQSLYGPPAY